MGFSKRKTPLKVAFNVDEGEYIYFDPNSKRKSITGTFEPVLINKTIEDWNARVRINGTPGSGKSYFAGKLVRDSNKQKVLITSVENTSKMKKLYPDDIDKLMVYDLVKILENVKGNILDMDLSNKLLIFDDIQTYRLSPNQKKLFNAFKNEVSCNGRQYDIDMIFLDQDITSGMATRTNINNTSAFVIFPGHGIWKQKEHLLKNYLYLSKEEIQKVKESKSRWIILLPECQTVVSEKEVWVWE